MQIQVVNGFIPHASAPPIAFRMMWANTPKAMEQNTQKPAVIFAPGFGSSLQTSPYLDGCLRHVAHMGAVSIGFNYSHTHIRNGQVDTGKLTCRNAEDDVARIIDFAKTQSMIDQNAMIGMGCSFGANTLLRMQPQELSSYVLFSLVPDLAKPFRDVLTPQKRVAWRLLQSLLGRGTKQVIEGDVHEINYNLFEQAEKIDLHERVKTLDKPVTIIQGTRDALAPVEDIRALQENMTQCPSPRVHFIENAGHAFACVPTTGRNISEFQEAMMVAQHSLASYFSTDIAEITQKRNSNIFVPFLSGLQNIVGGWLKNALPADVPKLKAGA